MAVQYNFLDNSFTEFENVENPKVTYKSPLIDDAFDITSGFSGVSQSGTPIARNTFSSELNVNNSEEHVPIQQNYTSVNKNISGRPKQALDFFIKNGFSQHAAAAIVGNLMLESGDPTLNKTDNIGDKKLGPNGSSYGMGQWRLDRRTALKNFAAKRGKPMSDFETQLEFVLDEINNGQKQYKILEGLNNAKTVEEATTSFMNTFERPNKDPKINGIQKRIKYAKSLLA